MRRWIRAATYHAWHLAGDKRRLAACMRELDAAHRLPPEALNALVGERLAVMLRHCRETVPYYASLLKHVAPERIDARNAVQILRDLPPLTKRELRDEFDRLISRVAHKRAYRNTSGGSTGEPAIFLQDPVYRVWSLANKCVFARWAGWSPGEPYVKIWGLPRETFREPETLKGRLRAWFLNEHYVNCYRVSDDVWQRCCALFERIRPVYVESYVDGAAEFARYLLRSGRQVPPPRGIVTSAGVLQPAVRQVIESGLRARVLNRYGSREVGDAACSCPEGEPLHISPRTHFVEILDEQGTPCPPGVEGEMHITLLTNFSMPLVRYRIGDRAAMTDEPCACGRHSPRLACVSGRSNEYLTASDGSRISGVAISTLWYDIPAVRQYQLHQVAADRVVLRIVPADPSRAEDIAAAVERVRPKFRELLGETVRLELELTDAIPTTPTGKHIYIRNDVANPPRTDQPQACGP